MSDQNPQGYSGVLTLPGEQEDRSVSLFVNSDSKTVSIQFESPIEGATEWQAQDVAFAQRLKYQEFVFFTRDLPKQTVDLTWKFNASLIDDTLAGVIIARPNDLRVTGEKGFVLKKMG